MLNGQELKERISSLITEEVLTNIKILNADEIHKN